MGLESFDLMSVISLVIAEVQECLLQLPWICVLENSIHMLLVCLLTEKLEQALFVSLFSFPSNGRLEKSSMLAKLTEIL